jgi:hypothetical protein
MSIWGRSYWQDRDEYDAGERDYERYHREDPFRSRYDGKSDAYFDGYDHAERDARRRQEEREEEEAAERRMDERRARERYEDQLYEERFDYKIQQEEHGADQ